MAPKANPHPVDPHTVIPEAVRRAAAAADAAMAANNPPPPTASPPASNDTISIAPPPAPERLPNVVTPMQIEQAPPPPPPPPVQPEVRPPQAAPAESEETWKNRYESILGRFRTANTTLEQANGRIEALENMLAATQAAAQVAPRPAPPAAKLITEQEEKDFGPEMIDLVRRAAREEMSTTEATLRAQVAELEGRVNGTNQSLQMNARQRMHADLDQGLPNWQEINNAQEFKDWLLLPDGFSGASRMKSLRDAYAQNRSPQVLSIFKAFVSEMAALLPADTLPAPVPAQQPPSRPTLESLAAPGRARTAAGTPPAPAEKQIIRTSDINRFYDDKRKGKYRGREEEFAKAELELSQAMQEGRVMRDT